MPILQIDEGLAITYDLKYKDRAMILQDAYNEKINRQCKHRGAQKAEIWIYTSELENVIKKIETDKLKLTPARVAQYLYDDYKIKLGRQLAHRYLVERHSINIENTEDVK